MANYIWYIYNYYVHSSIISQDLCKYQVNRLVKAKNYIIVSFWIYRRKLTVHEEKIKNIFNFAYGAFIIFVFSAGNALIYQAVAQKKLIFSSSLSHKNEKNYFQSCDLICYTVAFWIITCFWILVAITCTISCVAFFTILLINGRNKVINNERI
jgi:hypothetical protein